MRALGLCLLILSHLTLVGQDTILPVYTGEIPCFTDRPAADRDDPAIGRVLTDVPVPELHHYAPVPRADNETALLIIPGGGYAVEAWDHEGVDIARYLTHYGFHAFILSHRLPMQLSGECKSTAALSDAQHAILRIRSLATEYGYAPDAVGIMGFSAGGHLAGSASVHPVVVDSVSSRPDFSVLVYPVLLMDEAKNGHAGSQLNLLGAKPQPERLAYFNLPDQVDSLTPPTLLVHASDDRAVLPENSLRYYARLVEHGVPADLRIYATGGHGFGSARERTTPVSGWLEEVTKWLSGLTP